MNKNRRVWLSIFIVVGVTMISLTTYSYLNRTTDRKPLSEADAYDIINVFDEIYFSEYNRRNFTLSHRLLKLPVRPSMELVKEVELSPINNKAYEGYNEATATYKSPFSDKRENSLLTFYGLSKELSFVMNKKVSEDIIALVISNYDVKEKKMERSYFFSDDSKPILSDTRKIVFDEEELDLYFKKLGIAPTELAQASDDFIYNRVLKNWFNANEEYSAFTKNDLGEYIVVPDKYLKSTE